jgi:hypothetical protein
MLSHLTFPSKRVFAVTARMNIRPMSSMPKSGTWIYKELGYDTYAACLTPHGCVQFPDIYIYAARQFCPLALPC